MLRTMKLTFATILACGLFSGFAAGNGETKIDNVPTASDLMHGHYTVYFRKCDHEVWRKYGCYDCSCDARIAARSLQRSGYETMIQE